MYNFVSIKFFKDNVWYILFLLLLCIVNIKIVGDTFYFDKNDVVRSTREGYGDIPLHLSQITKFAYGQSDLSEPIYSGAKLQYPFLFNYLRGIILKMTGIWSLSVIWPLYFLVVANIVLVYLIYFEFSRNKFRSILASVSFFFASGFHWYYRYFLGLSDSSFYLDLKFPLQNISFGPTMVSIVHQHTFHFGLFLFLLTIYLIKKYSLRNLWVNILSVSVVAILPISHIHSFVAIGIYILTLFVSNLIKKDYKKSYKVFLIGFISFILSVPQLYFLLQNRLGGGFGQFRFGWMVHEGFGSANFFGEHSVLTLSYLNFLWINFGLFLLILFLGLFFVIYKFLKRKNLLDLSNWQLLISGLALLVLANIYQFQPWDFDNNKLIIYSIFFISLFIISVIDELFALIVKNNIVRTVIVFHLVIFMSLSGLIDVYNRFVFPRNNLYEVFNKESFDMAKYIILNTEKDAVILSSISHRNIAIALAGRSGVMGYDGWLWSRGISYFERRRELNNFFIKPSQSLDFLNKYNVGYILVDDKIVSDFNTSVNYFHQNYKKIYENSRYKLYKII